MHSKFYLYLYAIININAPYSFLLSNQCVLFSPSIQYNPLIPLFSNATLAEASFPAILPSTAKILKHLTHSQTTNASGFVSSVGYIYTGIRRKPIHEHSRSRMPMVTRPHLALLRKSRPSRELFGGQSLQTNQIHDTCGARFIWMRSYSPRLSFYCSKFQ
jgi:hypothetical protein